MLRRHKLVLLSMRPSVLFLVHFNNFDWITGFYWNYTLLLMLPVLMHSWYYIIMSIVQFVLFLMLCVYLLS